MIWTMPDETGGGVALLGADLILASRVRAALAGSGAQVRQVQRAELLPAARVVFVDLNSDEDARIEAISRIHARADGTTIVAFCDHDNDAVRRRAMAAGARHVVANRHLPEAARRLVTGAAGRGGGPATRVAGLDDEP
jgi:DNA-binding NarL/FixJ family response regulator